MRVRNGEAGKCEFCIPFSLFIFSLVLQLLFSSIFIHVKIVNKYIIEINSRFNRTYGVTYDTYIYTAV